ncbi:MAG: Hsp70 family protein, partial [Syntrophomonas sp.]
TTAADSQTSVDIHVLQGERKMSAQNVTLGRFQLVGIPAAPRGIPQIEVKFDIDANGIVNVVAKDMATNKEQRITITSSSGLKDDDIDRMVKDAEKYAEEDEKRVKEIEIKNAADSMVYQADKTLKDYKDQIDEESKSKIESAKEDLAAALQGEDYDDIKAKSDSLMEAIYAFTSKMYEKANPQGEQPGQPEDNVYDADYNIQDDDKK